MVRLARFFRFRLPAAAMLLVMLSCPGQDAAAEEISAHTLFQGVEQRFLDMDSLSYTVKKVSTFKGKQNEERWVFHYKKNGRVRIDYEAPHERLIVLDEKSLCEFIPVLKKAVCTDLASKPKDKADDFIARVMTHVSVDGLRVGNYEELEKKAVSVRKVAYAGVDAFLIEGAGPRYVTYIDPTKQVLLRSEIYDNKGGLVIRTEASRFTEAAKGFWMPKEIHITYHTPDGFVQSKVFLRDIKVDEKVPDELFFFNVPKGTTVIQN